MSRYRGLAAALEQARAGRTPQPFRPPNSFQGPGALDRLELPIKGLNEVAGAPLRLNRNEMASAVGGQSLLDRTMAGPQVPGYGSGLSTALKVLDFGRGAITSTLKETIDLFQGEAPNPGEWWSQATSHYGFSDLIRDERNTVGFGLAAIGAMTANPYLVAAGGTVLANNEWADRIVGFVGDVALDPLTYTGGLNIYARGWGSYKKAGIALDDLIRRTDDELIGLGLASNARGAEKTREVIRKAIARGEHDRSLVGFKRGLDGSDEGRKVMEATGLDAGMRIRMPGTGPVGQFMERSANLIPGRRAYRARIDRALGGLRNTPDGRFVQGWLDTRRIRNIPVAHLPNSGRGEVARALKGIRQHQVDAGKKLKPGYIDPRAGIDPAALKAAGQVARRHVEFKPTIRGKNIGDKFFSQADFIKRGFKRVAMDPGYAFRRTNQIQAGVRAGDVGVSLEDTYKGVYNLWRNANQYDAQWLEPMLRSGDPEQIAGAWRFSDAGRMARGAATFAEDTVDRTMAAVVKRVKINQGGQAVNPHLRKASYHILEATREGADLFVNGRLNRNSNWFKVLPPEVQALPDKVLENLGRDAGRELDEATKALIRTYGDEVAPGNRVWRAERELFADEGVGHVTRTMTPESRKAFGADDATDVTGKWDFDVHGRMTPRGLKNRQWGVDKPISLPEGSEALTQAKASKHAWFDHHGVYGKQGDWYLKADPQASGAFTPVKPNSVGKSVRTQIDEVSMAAFGRTMYEDDVLKALANWKIGLRRDISSQTMMRTITKSLGGMEIPPEMRARLVEYADEGTTSWDMGTRQIDWSGRPIPGRGGTTRRSAEVALSKVVVGQKAAFQASIEDATDALRAAGVGDDVIENLTVASRTLTDTVGELDVLYSELEVIGRELESIFQANAAKIAKGRYRVTEDVRSRLLRARDIAGRVEELGDSLLRTDPENPGLKAIVDRLFREIPDVAGESQWFETMEEAFSESILHGEDLLRNIATDPDVGQLGIINSKITQFNIVDETVGDLADLARAIDPDSPVARQVDEMRAAAGVEPTRPPPDPDEMTVYRGTTGGKGSVERGEIEAGALSFGEGTYITDNPTYAGQFGEEVTQYTLRVKPYEIFDMDAPISSLRGETAKTLAYDEGLPMPASADAARKFLQNRGYATLGDLYDESLSFRPGIHYDDPHAYINELLLDDGYKVIKQTGQIADEMMVLDPKVLRMPEDVAPGIADYDQTIRTFEADDAVVHHQEELKIGVTQELDMAETRKLLDNINARTGQMLGRSRVEELARLTASPAGHRQLPRTVDSFTDPTDNEVLAAVAQQADDATVLTDEAVQFRVQAQAATQSLVEDANRLGLNVSAGLDGQFNRLETQITNSGISELQDQLLPIVMLRDKAFAAELSAQAASREAADLLEWSKVGREAQAAMEAGGANIFNVTEGFIDMVQLKKNMPAFIDMMKDSTSNWGPWRMASGNAELDDAMVAAADAFQKLNSPVEVGKLMSGVDAFQNWWKAGAIATPGFVNRNVFGALYNAWLSDVDLMELVRAGRASTRIGLLARKKNLTFLQAAEELAKDNSYFATYADLVRVGVRGKGQATQSVRAGMQEALPENMTALDRVATGLRWAKSMDIFLPTGNNRAPLRVSLAPWSSNFALFRMVRSVNMQAEDVIRIGTGMDIMKMGGSMEDALDRIATTQFDYSELTASERKINQRLVPFYTWLRKNVPYQLDRLGRNPSKFNRILTTKRNLEQGTEEEGTVPDYFLEPFGIRLPFSWGGARVYSIPDMPFQDLFRLDPTQYREDEPWSYGIAQFMNQMAWQMTPLIKTPIEAIAPRARFQVPGYGGVPFSGEYEETPSIITKPFGFLMPLLERIGWARKKHGKWEMRDHHVQFTMNMLPTLAKMRRLFPSEEKFEKNLAAAWISSLGGISARPNTEEVQSAWRGWEKYRATLRRRREGLPPIPYGGGGGLGGGLGGGGLGGGGLG
jgi:hypothetical protein